MENFIKLKFTKLLQSLNLKDVGKWISKFISGDNVLSDNTKNDNSSNKYINKIISSNIDKD